MVRIKKYLSLFWNLVCRAEKKESCGIHTPSIVVENKAKIKFEDEIGNTSTYDDVITKFYLPK